MYATSASNPGMCRRRALIRINVELLVSSLFSSGHVDGSGFLVLQPSAYSLAHTEGAVMVRIFTSSCMISFSSVAENLVVSCIVGIPQKAKEREAFGEWKEYHHLR